jgi:hypothetical protein
MSSGRPPNVLRPTKLTTNLPEDIRAKLDLHLFSPVEGRIPHGAYSKFLAERVKEFFDPQSPAVKLAALKRRVIEVETVGWSDDQKLAIETFRDHILGLFP